MAVYNSDRHTDKTNEKIIKWFCCTQLLCTVDVCRKHPPSRQPWTFSWISLVGQPWPLYFTMLQTLKFQQLNNFTTEHDTQPTCIQTLRLEAKSESIQTCLFVDVWL